MKNKKWFGIIHSPGSITVKKTIPVGKAAE